MRRFTPLIATAGLLFALIVPAAADSRSEERADLGARLSRAGKAFRSREVSDRTRPALRKNVTVLGHVDPGLGFNADVVAHRGFAYLGSWGAFEFPDENMDFCPSHGVRVYSLHRPRRPVHVATFADGVSEPKLDGSWTEKVIVRHVNTRQFTGDLAAVSIQPCGIDGFAGFGLWNVTNPRRPQRLALYATPDTGGSHEIWLAARGNRAYVYTAIMFSEITTSPDIDRPGELERPGQADFRIIDVSDPRHPVKVGEWGAWAELGAIPFEGQGNEFAARFVHSVITNKTATRAYLSYWDLGTVILDISDPARPRFLGRTKYPDRAEGNAHSAWLARGENLLIQTDEDVLPWSFDGTERAWGFARFFDVSNPRDPVEIGRLMLPTTRRVPPPLGIFSVHDPKVRGGRAYFSWYSEGVVVADISRPRAPRVIGHFVPPGTADPLGFMGPHFLGREDNPPFPIVWGVFPYRNYVLASDINSGLWVLRVR